MSKDPAPSDVWWRRALRVGLLSFFLAVVVNYGADLALAGTPAVVAFLIVLLLIAINILFDTLGTSVTAAETPPLNAMAARKVPGAKQALYLVKHADRVANFCNDVVGDVTGAVTGAAGATVALKLGQLIEGGGNWVNQLLSLLIIGLIGGLTVGGKAAGKKLAIDRATLVVTTAGRIIYGAERLTGRSFTGGRGSNSSRRRTT